jgi:uncharacterized protein YcbX
MASDRTIVGHVRALYRYPVKSMRGESLDRAYVNWHGLEGDRRYAFVRADYDGHFPWLTGREVTELLRYRPYLAEPEQPKDALVVVRTPEGRDLPIESAELREELAARYGGPVNLLHLGRGAYDSSPVSLLTTATVTAIGAATGRALDPRRYRPNVLVEPASAGDFPEDAWQGALLVFGERADSVLVRVLRRISRCVMTTIDPETTERDPAVLKAAGRIHNTCAGIYAVPEAPGSICVGDTITLTHG